MVILLTGATGFIGRRLAAALRAAGHIVVEAGRSSAACSHGVAADFTRDLKPKDWAPKLAGVDVVVNAVGILRERGGQTFASVHTCAPRALFAACAAAGVRRVVQISALGADRGSTGYFASKRAADDYLAGLPLEWTIVQPSLVYGEGGTSARLFNVLATLPITPLPAGGRQHVQPIHVDDLVQAIVNMLGSAAVAHQRVPLVGPRSMSLREFLQQLRTAMGLRPAPVLSAPHWMMRISASIAQWSPRSLLDRETLVMLEMGNVADPSITQHLLRRPPREVAAFIPVERRAITASQSKLAWLLPLMRFSIALVWIWTGIVSLGWYPRESSYALLARTGAPHVLFPFLLYGAAALDFVFGAATMLLSNRRRLWLAQLALIVAYTIVVTAKLPEYWLHPYGPILKNLPMLAAIYLLYELEQPIRGK
ncbi:MAG TPA: SDR family oxidoreductase [Steroidobacter sp.]|jgi:uncharacterized protein YbjT (DUF2867 family)|nr:SDR family oxidoreductase [Steroidobacter sp.]